MDFLESPVGVRPKPKPRPPYNQYRIKESLDREAHKYRVALE